MRQMKSAALLMFAALAMGKYTPPDVMSKAADGFSTTASMEQEGVLPASVEDVGVVAPQVPTAPLLQKGSDDDMNDGIPLADQAATSQSIAAVANADNPNYGMEDLVRQEMGLKVNEAPVGVKKRSARLAQEHPTIVGLMDAGMPQSSPDSMPSPAPAPIAPAPKKKKKEEKIEHDPAYDGPHAFWGKEMQVKQYGSQKHVRRGYPIHQLSYLGRETVLDYEPWTGNYRLWKYEREINGMCDVFPYPPVIDGTWTIKHHALVFLGYTKLLDFDPSSGQYTISECDEAFFNPQYSTNKKKFSCKPWAQDVLLLKNTKNYDVVYLGVDTILQYARDTGEYIIHKFDRENPEDPFPLPTQGFSTTDKGLYFTYLGSDLLMAYEASFGIYKVLSVNRQTMMLNLTDSISTGKFPTAATFQPNPNFHRFVSVMENELIDYDADTGEFQVLKCSFDNFTIGQPLPCTRLAQADFPSAPTTMGCENYTNLTTCTADNNCGWCMEKQQCFRGGPLRPCFFGTSCLEWYYNEPKAIQLARNKPSPMPRPSPSPSPSPLAKQVRRNRTALIDELPVVEIPEDLLFIPKFDSHELTYLGRDAVFDYEPTTGHYRIWQFDRTLAEKGEPFLHPPLVRGLWTAPNRRVVYMGFDRLLDYSPTSGRYNFWACDHTFWSSGRPMQCSNVGEGKDPTLKGDKQLMYIGMDCLLMMHNPTGRYEIYKYSRKEGKRNLFPSNAVLASGMWPQLRNSMLSYMGGDMMLTYDELTGSYRYWMLKRQLGNSTNDPLDGPIAEGAFSDTRHRFVSMQEDRLVDLDPTTGSYRVLQCDRTPCEAGLTDKDMAMIKPMTCDTFGSGAFRGDEVEEEEDAVVPLNHETVYMEGTHDEHHLFDYDPTTGRYRIFAFKSLRVHAQCAPLPFPSLVEGVWPFTDHRFVSLGKDSLLDYDIENGAFRVWFCDRNRYTPNPTDKLQFEGVRGPSKMPCSPKAAGLWAELAFRNSSELAYLDGDRMFDVDPMTGNYKVWSFPRDPNNIPSLPGKVIASGNNPILVGKEFTYVKDSMLMLVEPTTGSYELMVYDRDATKDEPVLQGPIAQGTFNTKDRSVFFLGEDRFMTMDQRGNYQINSCDRKDYQAGVPLPCEPLGQANLRQETGCNYTSCSLCSNDPACGWCTNTQKCIPGGPSGACEDSQCQPDNWEYGYCADEPCGFFHTCEDCLGTKFCGWCESSKECVPGTDSAPLTGTCDTYKYRFCAEPLPRNATVVHFRGF